MTPPVNRLKAYPVFAVAPIASVVPALYQPVAGLILSIAALSDGATPDTAFAGRSDAAFVGASAGRAHRVQS